jgi:hypothetical protein
VDAWTSIPWVEPVTVSDLTMLSSAEPVTIVPAEAVNALPAENAEATDELRAAAQDYADLLAEPDADLVTGLERATLRSASTGWRDDPAAGVEYASAITDDLTERLKDVRVTVPESVTLSSRTGVFPLTVTNDLDEPVMVKLAIQAANPDRLRVAEVEEQRVEAGSRETVEVRAEAATNGRVPITVQLVTTNRSPLGPATQTVVNATDYGTIGWVIIAGAAALFGASVLRTSLRRRGASPDDVSPTDDVSPRDDAVPEHDATSADVPSQEPTSLNTTSASRPVTGGLAAEDPPRAHTPGVTP